MIILIVIGTVQCGFIGGWCASETGLISFKTMVRRSNSFLGFHDSGDGNSFDNR
jgi:energy-converting hydrogenase Eha subunit G